MATKTAYTTVSLPKPLVARVKKFIRGTGFASSSSFVEFVVRDVLATGNGRARGPSDAAGESRVKARLRALGYL